MANHFFKLYWLLLLFLIIHQTAAAQRAKISSFSLNAGLYHPFASAPAKSAPENRYTLQNGFFLSLDFFTTSFWKKDVPRRIGLRYIYERVRGNLVESNSLAETTIENYHRAYSMHHVAVILQNELYRSPSTMLLLDLGAGASFMSYQDEDTGRKPCSDATFICFPFDINFGMQLGFVWLIRFNNILGVKIGTGLQLQSGSNALSYPFSRGIFFSVGLALK